MILLRRTPRRDDVPDDKQLRVNHRINVPRVLVIDEKGNKLGEFLTKDAVTLAEERGLDLVEVSPKARPPVCRITDFGKLKYEQKKRASVARKKQVQVQLKEIKLRPKTDIHDFNVKVSNARRFLADGNKVRITVRFRGRELAHRDIGIKQCLRVAQACEDVGIIEITPRPEGRVVFLILAPLVKKVPPTPSSEKPKPAAPEKPSAPEAVSPSSAETGS